MIDDRLGALQRLSQLAARFVPFRFVSLAAELSSSRPPPPPTPLGALEAA